MIASTSKQAYTSIKKKLGDKQRKVYKIIQELEPITNESISEKLDWPINRVTGRVSELVKMEYVAHEGHDITKSGRRAKTWVSKTPSEVIKKLNQSLLLDIGEKSKIERSYH